MSSESEVATANAAVTCPEGSDPRVSTPAESLNEVNGWKENAPTSSFGRERPTTCLITSISPADSRTAATRRAPARWTPPFAGDETHPEHPKTDAGVVGHLPLLPKDVGDSVGRVRPISLREALYRFVHQHESTDATQRRGGLVPSHHVGAGNFLLDQVDGVGALRIQARGKHEDRDKEALNMWPERIGQSDSPRLERDSDRVLPPLRLRSRPQEG